jgi:hypothetical protein
VKLVDEQIASINALLVQHGFRVMEISPYRESLEQVFLRLTRETQDQRGIDVTTRANETGLMTVPRF